MKTSVYALITFMALVIGFIGNAARAQDANQNQNQDPNAAAAQNPARAQAQAKSEQQAAQQRKDAEQEARKSLDQDAIAAIKETQTAIQSISDGKTDQALAALERATGKISLLTARNPATALIPVAVEVNLIDMAPLDRKAIKTIGKAAEDAVEARDFPAARVLLQELISEIRIRTYNLPLATYPIAMRDAAQLLDQKKTEEAKALLTAAINTLAVIDRVTPLPLVTADVAIAEAQAQKDKDKDGAKQLLAVAKQELARAKELGYAGKDPEYAALNDAISDVEKQINGNQNSDSAFSRLKERVASFFHRQSESKKGSEVASTR